jgi:hypothetical protein
MPIRIVIIEIWGVCSSFALFGVFIAKLNRIINKLINFSPRDEATRISRKRAF